MNTEYIRAVNRSSGQKIQGILAKDDGKTVFIISGGELFHCIHELYDFFEIDVNGVLLGKEK